MIQKIKGTQDFIDLSLYNFIIEKVKKELLLNHFTHIDTPLLEPAELFVRSLGEHTDVVSKEMYSFSTSEAGEIICLRPEATASTMRAFIENGIQQTPWKVFSYGPMFRHERPQKGRYRQFHQINIELIGAQSLSYDVQLISLLDHVCTQMLAHDAYALTINFLGCTADRTTFKKALYLFLQDLSEKLCQTCIKRKDANILRIFDCKNSACQTLYEDAPRLTDFLCTECNQEWKQLQTDLDIMSVSYTINHRLVRGLDYYNKTIFEFVSLNLGAQNAFCGGGRYDGLCTTLGGSDQPAIGAALGIERLMLLLEPIKDTLALPQQPALHVLIPLDVQQHALALLLHKQLTGAGLCADIFFEHSLKGMMRKANKLGAKYCLLLGEKEQQDKTVTIKQMLTGTEKTVKQIDMLAHLQ